MLARIRKSMAQEEGFTLIELLVVVIIIGILSAIAIPTFLNQRTKGWNAAAQSALKNAATAEESFRSNNALYAQTLADLTGEGFKDTTDTPLGPTTFIAGTSTGYCLSAKHINSGTSGTTWYITAGSGRPTTTPCSAAG